MRVPFTVLLTALLPTAVIATTVIAAGPASAAPSFECRGASGDAEFAICGSDRLSLLDRVLTDRVREIAAAGGRRAEEVRAGQRDWVEARDACGADVLCIEAAYLARLRELGA